MVYIQFMLTLKQPNVRNGEFENSLGPDEVAHDKPNKPQPVDLTFTRKS